MNKDLKLVGTTAMVLLICFVVMTGFYFNAHARRIAAVEAYEVMESKHRLDSLVITKLREDAGKTMMMLEQGSQGKDTVYYQDKSGKRFVIQFQRK